MNRTGTVFLGVLGALMAGPATADESRFDLGAIDIIEVKGEQPEGWNEPISATISLEEIQKFERYDVADAANLLPGVTIQNIGGRSERLLFVRGFNSRQVPLFIDGVPVYVPYDGNVDLGRFTTFDIAEISVTKAFTSMLYGANTLGGSVNLVSRRPSEKLEIDGGAGTVLSDNGNDSRWRTWGNVGTNQGNWYLQAGGSWTQSDGFRLPDEFDPVPTEDGGRRENSKNKDWKVSFKAGYTPNETDEYSISYSNQQGEKQTPPYAGDNPFVRARFWRWPEWDKESVYFISKTAFGEDEYVKLRAYYDKFDNTLESYDNDTYTTQLLPFAFVSVYDDYTAGGAIEVGTTRFDRHALSAAFHYKRDVHRETDDIGSPEERYEDEIMTLGLEDTISATDRLTMVLGWSWTRQETLQADNVVNFTTIVPFPTDSSTAMNFQGGVIFEISDAARVRVSGSKRTRFPTIKDKYSFRFGSALPNPGLEAEDAVHFEIGLDGNWSWMDYGVNLFYSDLDDAIENVNLPPASCFQPPCVQLQNVGGQVNRGVEALLGATFNDQWRVHANYTYLNRENQSVPEILPIDVPKHKLFGYVEYSPFSVLDLIATGEYNSSRFSSTFGDRVADNFTVFNLKASWRPLEHVEADLGVNNLADNEYAYEEGFPEPGRTYFLNLKYSQ
jgi:iron complex outermembrane receptor protein